MEASHSTTKNKRNSDGQSYEDRKSIDNLPEAVLCHILSFLPTKHAVATSILSSRWRYLWTSLPNLNFEVSEVYAKRHGLDKFNNFVESVLLRVTCIKKFRLSIQYHGGNALRINSWIYGAITRNVEHLDVGYKADRAQKRVRLPMSLLTYEKLTVLKLHGRVKLDGPEVWLPNLKILHFTSFVYLSNAFIGRILSGCPILEELVLDEFSYWQGLDICSTSLTRLTIKTDIAISVDGIAKILTINTPKLEFFDLKDYVTSVFQLIKFPSLVKADIDVKRSDYSEISIDVYEESVIQLMKQIVEAKDLRLSSNVIDVLCDADVASPVFANLTRLNIRGYRVSSTRLRYLLDCSPVLEVITFDKVYHLCRWNTELKAPRCCLTSLKIIEFLEFMGSSLDMEMIEYFIKNSMCLEKLIIHQDKANGPGPIERESVLKKMLKFTRASKACEVTYLPCPAI